MPLGSFVASVDGGGLLVSWAVTAKSALRLGPKGQKDGHDAKSTICGHKGRHRWSQAISTKGSDRVRERRHNFIQPTYTNTIILKITPYDDLQLTNSTAVPRLGLNQGLTTRESEPMSTLTTTHNTQDMSQWMTSGASRLRSKQNRSFAARAQQRAAAASVVNSTHSTSRTSGRRQSGGRRLRMAGTSIKRVGTGCAVHENFP